VQNNLTETPIRVPYDSDPAVCSDAVFEPLCRLGRKSLAGSYVSRCLSWDSV